MIKLGMLNEVILGGIFGQMEVNGQICMQIV